MAKRETVKVKVKLYDEVLAWINEQREEFGLKPIKKIPDGLTRCTTQCPIANGLGDALKQLEDGVTGNLGDAVEQFIEEVDAMGEDVKVRVQRGLRAAA